MNCGLVNISEEAVITSVNEIAKIPFFPVSLKSEDLGKHLFREGKAFTDISQGK